MSMLRIGATVAAGALMLAGVLMLRLGFQELSRGMTLSAVTRAPSEVSGPIGDWELPNPNLSPSAPDAAINLVPRRVRIPSIHVDADVVDLGLEPDRTIQVPEDVSLTGWYTGRSVPGEVGPSVLVGHVDSAVAGVGVFYNLRNLQEGDSIEIERSDGSVAEFRVTSTIFVNKDEFPTKEVYGATRHPTLRLITCGGAFDRSSRSYVDNVIVYAEHLGNYGPAALRS